MNADGYATEYDFITRCRFFAIAQQQVCRGYPRGHTGRCPWWRNHGDSVYHCTLPAAQLSAVREFKQNNMEGQEK